PSGDHFRLPARSEPGMSRTCFEATSTIWALASSDPSASAFGATTMAMKRPSGDQTADLHMPAAVGKGLWRIVIPEVHDPQARVAPLLAHQIAVVFVPTSARLVFGERRFSHDRQLFSIGTPVEGFD